MCRQTVIRNTNTRRIPTPSSSLFVPLPLSSSLFIPLLLHTGPDAPYDAATQCDGARDAGRVSRGRLARRPDRAARVRARRPRGCWAHRGAAGAPHGARGGGRGGRTTSIIDPGEFNVSGNHAEEDRGRSGQLVDLPYGVHSNRAEDSMSLDDVDLHFTFSRYCLSAKEAAKGVTAGRLAMSGTQFLKVRTRRGDVGRGN